MKKRKMLVKRIKALKDSRDGKKRFSLQEDGFNYCVVTVSDVLTEEAIQSLLGKEIIRYEREITLENGTNTNGWYLLTDEDAKAYAKREAERDVDVMIETEKQIKQAQVKVSLAEALKAAGAAAFAA